MGTLLATIRKEALLLARDKAGLAIIFLMPLALVFIITLVQDAPLKQFHEVRMTLLLADADGGRIGALVADGLERSGAFAVTTLASPGDDPAAAVRREIDAGRYQVGVVVPAGATDALERSVASLVPAGAIPGLPAAPAAPAELLILADPALPKQGRAAAVNAVRYLAATIETRALAAVIAGLASPSGLPGGPPAPGAPAAPAPSLLSTRLDAGPGEETAVPNAVQQNVPAWTMFAMFFIVVPLAGMMIREKNEMIALRLLTMPSAFVTRVGGKMAVYLGVCLLQFLLMVGMGMHVLPRFGVPALAVGDGWPPLLVMAVAAALAATAYGILVGTVATTIEQAASFGAVSVIIMAVVGGVMVPTFAMPAAMRHLSAFSPLHWGLAGFLDVFLRGAGVPDVLANAGRLLLFAAAAMAAAWLWFRARRRA